MASKGKLVWIPVDILKEIDQVKIETGIKSNSDALRSIFKNKKENYKKGDLIRW